FFCFAVAGGREWPSGAGRHAVKDGENAVGRVSRTVTARQHAVARMLQRRQSHPVTPPMRAQARAADFLPALGRGDRNGSFSPRRPVESECCAPFSSPQSPSERHPLSPPALLSRAPRPLHQAEASSNHPARPSLRTL